MNHTIPYNLSKDYKLLFELVKAGNRMVCFVDYKWSEGTEPCRDICTIRNSNYEAQSRGNGYFGLIDVDGTEDEMFQTFNNNCKASNLEWIVPHAL